MIGVDGVGVGGGFSVSAEGVAADPPFVVEFFFAGRYTKV